MASTARSVLGFGGLTSATDLFLQRWAQASQPAALASSVDTRIQATRTGTLRNLFMQRNAAGGAAAFGVRVNGVGVSLVASFGAADLTASDSTGAAAVNAGDTIEVVQIAGVTGNSHGAEIQLD